MQVDKILLTRDRPEQFASFFVRSFQWNHTIMTSSRVLKAYHFLKISANCVWLTCYFTVFMILKTSFQNISKTLSQNTIIEPIMAGTYFLKQFLKKTPGTEKHKDK